MKSLLNNLKKYVKNPLIFWFYTFFNKLYLKYKYRYKMLDMGTMSYAHRCSFGIYNTIYNYVSLTDVILGDYTYIGDNTKIINTNIGKYCSIASNCSIALGQHPTSKFVSTHPMFFSTAKQCQISLVKRNYYVEYKQVTIMNDVWIGNNSIIMDGVTINNGVIVAAGSVVTKDIPAYAIVGGVPAKIIKYRFNENEIEKLLQCKWWDMEFNVIKNNYTDFHDIEKFLINCSVVHV